VWYLSKGGSGEGPFADQEFCRTLMRTQVVSSYSDLIGKPQIRIKDGGWYAAILQDFSQEAKRQRWPG
jgi:hypothetical protein